ncbi:MAG: hypothetical protein KDA66_04565 [Planctomycetaceae bacterium]|nr:hypothetical protein [Planctomycetaceae bacterium]
MRQFVVSVTVGLVVVAVMSSLVLNRSTYPATSATNLVLRQVMMDVASYAVDKGEFPTLSADVYGEDNLPTDNWGEPIWFQISEDDETVSVRAFSAGQDRTRGTRDDLSYEFDMGITKDELNQTNE